MCQFLSAIVTKNNFYYDALNDSHEQLIEKYNLNDRTTMPDFVRVEITPQDGDITNTNLENWGLRVDQDYVPDWFCEKEVEVLAKNKLQEVFFKYYILDTEMELLEDRKIKVLKNTKINLVKNSQVNEMRENSQVNVMRENSQVNEMWENSQVNEMWENSLSINRLTNEIVTPNENFKIRIWKKR